MELKYFHNSQCDCWRVTSNCEWAGRSTSFFLSEFASRLSLASGNPCEATLQSVHLTRKWSEMSLTEDSLQFSKHFSDQIYERLLKGMVESHQNVACYMTAAMCYLRWTFEVVLPSKVSLHRGECMFWTLTSFQVTWKLPIQPPCALFFSFAVCQPLRTSLVPRPPARQI